MVATINIGVDISIAKFLDTRGLFTSSSGGGKSYLLRKFAEVFAPTGIQQIIIDPESEFFTLREKFDFALVSKDGDIPLNVEYAEVLAQKILETRVSVILDLYELPPAGRILFVKRFLHAMINADKSLWHPCIVYLDEADKFAPEGAGNESTKEVVNLCAMGRKRGYCAVLATQRLSKLKKDVTAELLNKFVGRTGQDIDRRRAGDELGLATKGDIGRLRELEPGEFYPSGPAVGYDLTKFKVKKVITTHPQSGSRIAATPPIPNAVKKIVARLSDIPKVAQKELETKKELQEEVTRLSQALRQATKGGGKADQAGEIQELQGRIKAQLYIIDQQQVEIEGLKSQIKHHRAIFNKIEYALRPFLGDSTDPPPLAPPSIAGRVDPRPVVAPSSIRANAPASSTGPMKMLKILAMLQGEAVSRERLSLLSGYSLTSSTFGIYINKLKQAGHAIGEDGNLMITADGVAAAGDFERLPTDPPALISFWTAKLDKGPATMFSAVVDHHPGRLTREQLSEKSGYRITSSTFGIYLNKLKALHLVKEREKMIGLADYFFK